MKAILPEISLEVISNHSTLSLHVILYANLNATKCKTLIQTKRILNLYALPSTQIKNQNKKHETNLTPCLDKALLFKGKKVRERKGKTKENDLTRLGVGYT